MTPCSDALRVQLPLAGLTWRIKSHAQPTVVSMEMRVGDAKRRRIHGYGAYLFTQRQLRAAAGEEGI